MGRNDQGRVFQETAASGKVAWLRVPVFAPERPGVTGRMSTETRDFLSTFLTGAGIAVFALAVGLITGREIVILASLPAGVGCAILWRASVVYERVNTVMEAETGLRPDPPDQPRFIATLPGGMPNASRLVDRPEGWTMDGLRRFARETYKDGSYNIAYGNRPDWVTEGMLDAFREWGQKKGYGRTPGERRAWVWSESGVDFMDGLRG